MITKLKNGLIAGLLAIVSLFSVGMIAACGNEADNEAKNQNAEASQSAETKAFNDITLSDGQKLTDVMDDFNAEAIEFKNALIKDFAGTKIDLQINAVDAYHQYLGGRVGKLLKDNQTQTTREAEANYIEDSFKFTYTVISEQGAVDFEFKNELTDEQKAQIAAIISISKKVSVELNYSVATRKYSNIEYAILNPMGGEDVHTGDNVLNNWFNSKVEKNAPKKAVITIAE